MSEFQRGPQSIISKATTGVGAVLVTTLLCWLPLVDEEILKALLWCITAGCVNSCINPFIYYYKFNTFGEISQSCSREFGEMSVAGVCSGLAGKTGRASTHHKILGRIKYMNKRQRCSDYYGRPIT